MTKLSLPGTASVVAEALVELWSGLEGVNNNLLILPDAQEFYSDSSKKQAQSELWGMLRKGGAGSVQRGSVANASLTSCCSGPSIVCPVKEHWTCCSISTV